MKTIDEVENLLKEKRNVMTDISRKATDDLRKEIMDLEREKHRLTAEKRILESKFLEKAIPIINRISGKVIQLNASGKCTLWIDFSGHVKLFRISGYKGPYSASAENFLNNRVYLEISEYNTEENIFDDLKEIEDAVDTLAVQDDW